MFMMFLEIKITITILMMLTIIFFMLNKMEKWDNYSSMTFECGFNSYNFYRFSYSSHYYIVSLLFLFLDLEFCFMIPYMFMYYLNLKMMIYLILLIIAILMSLMLEWKMKSMNWKN